jgi:endonuclease/exonuclease/phosphatase family metal-dependent hydrolase
LRILTWNLFHGRSVPAAGQPLAGEFAGLLAGWDWDVALLQEVPPWWPGLLAAAANADQRMALTSRNAGLALRRALAGRWPDALKANGGGCNAILARQPIVEHSSVRLRVWPERRVAQLGRLADGVSVVNFHGSARAELAQAELERLWELALAWAAGAPLLLGGDLNLRGPLAPQSDIVRLASRDVDHLFARGARTASDGEQLDRHVALGGRSLELSDHVPLAAEVELGAPLTL